MIIDTARIVTCPYCGEKKELFSMASGNTIGATFWSDGKMYAPMLRSVSPVQKCPKCGNYYLQYKQKGERSNNYSGETGDLSFSQWEEAYQQFSEGKLSVLKKHGGILSLF